MQRVADVARVGATHYLQGSTRLQNTAFRTVDFHRRFQINESRARTVAARKQGKAVARWLGWHNGGVVHWVLLLEPGKTAETTEKWRDLVKDKIELTNYQLVRQTRPGARAPVWTWRYSSRQEQHLRDQLVQAIRQRHDGVVAQLVHSLWNSPGFRGVRDQVKRFKALALAEWRRSRSANEAPPQFPALLRYVRRLGDAGSVWSELMTESKNELIET